MCVIEIRSGDCLEVMRAMPNMSKAALAEELAEKFAPRYESGAVEPRFFRVVWC